MEHYEFGKAIEKINTNSLYEEMVVNGKDSHSISNKSMSEICKYKILISQPPHEIFLYGTLELKNALEKYIAQNMFICALERIDNIWVRIMPQELSEIRKLKGKHIAIRDEL